MKISLLTGCQDKHYALAIAMGLIANGIGVDVIGSDEVDSEELHSTANLQFLNLRGSQRKNVNLADKVSKLIGYYFKLITYALGDSPKIFHILWNNELEMFDRTFLMMYFKLLRKQIALTAHNVNRAKRDAKDSWLNHLTLGMQYRLCSRIFVHTQKMKDELCAEFGVVSDRVVVINYPINNAVPETALTPADAKKRLDLEDGERVVLFFGKIRPYKGIECLLDAFHLMVKNSETNYRLLVVGEPKKGSEQYLDEIRQSVADRFGPDQVRLHLSFVPDGEIEVYFKAADVLVLPYKDIFQSGVLFVAYSFGLPVIATDVGSFRDDIVEGKTGFVCKAGDPEDLSRALERYFGSDLFENLKVRRRELIDYANEKHSWNGVGQVTRSAYVRMLRREPS